MIKTLGLNEDWDLALDGYGNIAVLEGHGRVAQDVATAVKLFRGEAIFHIDMGVPYLADILANSPQEAIIRSHLTKRAYTVPDVATVEFRRISFKNRIFTGELIITDTITADTDIDTGSGGKKDDFYSLIDVYEAPNIYRMKV
jgi:hypothetical protein